MEEVHSFRGGRTSDLANMGYSIDQIKALGRWKFNAVYRYLKKLIAVKTRISSSIAIDSHVYVCSNSTIQHENTDNCNDKIML